MIVQENINIGGQDFVKTYSDKGLFIRQIETGREFAEAYDIQSAQFTYEETDEPIPPRPETPEE